MKKINWIAILLSFTIISCVRTECVDCTKMFYTDFSDSQLDSISQGLVNYHSTDSVNYLNWQEFFDLNFPDSEVKINETEEVCSKYGGMVSVDPIASAEETEDVWWSDGSMTQSHEGEIQEDSTLVEIGTMRYNCN